MYEFLEISHGDVQWLVGYRDLLLREGLGWGEDMDGARAGGGKGMGRGQSLRLSHEYRVGRAGRGGADWKVEALFPSGVSRFPWRPAPECAPVV